MNGFLKNCPISKREARKQDRREAILEVAARSFMEKGYAATSMSAIAAELGGSKGTLWSYFPSKEELFAAVLDHVTAVYRQTLLDLLDPCGDTRSTITRFCDSFLRKIISPEAIALHRLISSEVGRFPEIGRIFDERAPRMTQEILARYLADRMAVDGLRRDDPRLAARALIGLCLSGVRNRMMWGIGGPPTEEEIATEVCENVEIFMRAFGSEEGGEAVRETGATALS